MGFMAPLVPFLSMNSQQKSCSLVHLFIFSLLLVNFCTLEARKALESDFDTFEVNSLLSASSCKDSVQGPSRPGSLKVTHRYGPCSKLNHQDIDTPTLVEVLAYDQSRVASIQNQVRFDAELVKVRDTKTTIPAKPGNIIGTGNYVVSVGLGTPTKYLTLVFDTGSDLTWTQCQPCTKSCYDQQDPIFNPSSSSSYGNISCNSAQCSQLSSATGNAPACSISTCVYGIQYGDQSFSIGFLAKEKLTLTPNDVFDNFFFGCGENNQGLFGKTAGLLGLGRDAVSVVSQTSQKYGKYFSYCLPTKSGSNGHLSFGKRGAPKNLVFTPLGRSKDGTFYYVNIVAIFVGGKQMPINPSVFQQGGNIIDSGTVITRLAPTAYTALQNAFKQQMKHYPSAPGISILDTCYDFSNYTTVTIPKISILFSGNTKVDLAFLGVLVAVSQSQVCLAFAGNDADTDMGIYGNVQQQTFEVAYDVVAGKLGFGPGGCS